MKCIGWKLYNKNQEILLYDIHYNSLTKYLSKQIRIKIVNYFGYNELLTILYTQYKTRGVSEINTRGI